MKQKTNLKKIINRGATESALSNSLVPQCLSWICSTLTETRLLCLRTSRLIPFAIRTHFVPSVRKSARTLSTYQKYKKRKVKIYGTENKIIRNRKTQR